MKEPTGNIEAELQSLQRQIDRLLQDNRGYKLELELANKPIVHLEGLIEQYKYQEIVNQNRSADDWK